MKPQMRFSIDRKKIILNEDAIKQNCIVKTFENKDGSVFKLMSEDNKILQTMN
jgi:hypothetical protein